MPPTHASDTVGHCARRTATCVAAAPGALGHRRRSLDGADLANASGELSCVHRLLALPGTVTRSPFISREARAADRKGREWHAAAACAVPATSLQANRHNGKAPKSVLPCNPPHTVGARKSAASVATQKRMFLTPNHLRAPSLHARACNSPLAQFVCALHPVWAGWP